MVFDVRNDVPELLDYVRRRVDVHIAATGKSKNKKPVKLIECGFEVGQANWVALVFDTRSDAEPDGSWSEDIEDILLARPEWPLWDDFEGKGTHYVINMAGKKIKLADNLEETVCTALGEMLKHVLLTARSEGVFGKLPKTERCELGIEHLDGCYGWPNYEDRGKENIV